MEKRNIEQTNERNERDERLSQLFEMLENDPIVIKNPNFKAEIEKMKEDVKHKSLMDVYEHSTVLAAIVVNSSLSIIDDMNDMSIDFDFNSENNKENK